jgi:hypothetical protein
MSQKASSAAAAFGKLSQTLFAQEEVQRITIAVDTIFINKS